MLSRFLCWLAHRHSWGVISERHGYVHAFASFECSRCGLLWENRVVGLIRPNFGDGGGYRPRPYGSAPSMPPTNAPNMGTAGIKPSNS